MKNKKILVIIILLILIIFIFYIKIVRKSVQNPGGNFETQSPVEFENANFFIGADGTQHSEIYDYLKPLADNGIKHIGLEYVVWDYIEPSETSGYLWDLYDSIVQKTEKVGAVLDFTIWSKSNWATESSAEGRPSSPPKESYEQKYYNFVKTYVERYDNDGIDDMPGLKYSHNYITIEDEAQNLGDSWIAPSCNGDVICSAEKYGENLKLAYNAAKEANPNSIVSSFSFNPGDYFDANDKNTIPENNKVVFLDKVFTDYWNYFDVISIQCNYDYTGIPTWVKYIDDTYNKPKKVSERKPIVCADAATMPMLNKHQFYGERFKNKYPYLSDDEIIKIIYEDKSNKYDEIKGWWEAEKARLSVKKAVVAVGEGVEGIFFQFLFSPDDNPNNIWSFSGLLGRGLNDEETTGVPRIVVYALGQLNKEISNFQVGKNLNPIPLGQDPYDWLWMYRFDNVYVLWDESEDVVDLSKYISSPEVKATYLTTEFESGEFEGYDPKFVEKVYPVNAVPVSNTPIFIET